MPKYNKEGRYNRLTPEATDWRKINSKKRTRARRDRLGGAGIQSTRDNMQSMFVRYQRHPSHDLYTKGDGMRERRELLRDYSGTDSRKKSPRRLKADNSPPRQATPGLDTPHGRIPERAAPKKYRIKKREPNFVDIMKRLDAELAELGIDGGKPFKEGKIRAKRRPASKEVFDNLVENKSIKFKRARPHFNYDAELMPTMKIPRAKFLHNIIRRMGRGYPV